MSKKKRKPKRKKHDVDDIWRRLKQFGIVIIRMIAGFLMMMLIGTMLLLIYLKSLYPNFDVSVWVTMSGLFAYLSGYLALEGMTDEPESDDEDGEKPKNDWSDFDE